MTFIILLIIAATLFAYEEYFEWVGTKEADVKEHITSVFHRASLLLAGYFYPFGIKEILLCLVVYWVLTDGIMNLLKDRNFFAISETSGSPIEKISTWYVKLILLVVSILIILT